MTARLEMGGAGRAVMENVQRLRKLRGMNYEQLSGRLRELGHPIAVLGLSRLERGERRVDVDDLTALAKALGVGTAGLLGEDACATCDDKPPAGFTCNACGKSAD